MAVKKEIKIIQSEENPIPTEILAAAIISFSESASKMLSSGLKRRTIAILLHDDIPSRFLLSRAKIEAVLEALPLLATRHTNGKISK